MRTGQRREIELKWQPKLVNSEEFLKNASDEAGVHKGENRHLFLSDDTTEVYNMGFIDYLQNPELSKASKFLKMFKKGQGN